ncbi:MAG TPA: hypothetical protein VMB05_18455 [Solirubrobacteraceae bacterium]|nr:hypothetical protein [Solirubrobacteraceae bacterium]
MVGGKKLGLVFAVVLALGALVATTASAHQLTYQTCVKAAKVGKTYTGKYNDKECKEVNAKGEGKYEAQAVAEGTTYTGKDKAVVITAGGKTVTCKKGTEAGEYVAEKVASEQFTFASCSSGKKEACTSPSAAAGVIQSSTVKTKLVYLNPGETEVGVFVIPAQPWLEFTCGATTIAVEGRFIGSVENTKKGPKFTFATSGGKQQHQFFYAEEEAEEAFGPFTLFTEPGEAEATISGSIENGPKGAYAA